ncbi:MAG TPA: FHA domain-containing protein [Acidimicrobiales bacterium]|nr:FHA domain-containing protein [Acidimicrobiales bacterium]
MAEATTTITIGVGSQRFEVAEGDELTFGRSQRNTICLDPADLGISRIAGALENDAGVWWLVNRSGVRPLEVVDDVGIRTVLPPGRRVAVTGPITVIVEGATRRHALTVDLSPEAMEELAKGPFPAVQMEGNPTRAAGDVAITSADKLALVALFAGYLEPFPRYDPHPKSYADAAARLNWPRTTLVKRVEYLRTRLTNAGVPNLLGDNALQHLAEWALATGLISRADLALLPPK